MPTFDVNMNVEIPIVVAIDAANAEEAVEKALDIYENGELNDRIRQSFRENNETVNAFVVLED